jgi:predicted short-subunit dehydrogenase-like oxidoreductase (DUF2520 family)
VVVGVVAGDATLPADYATALTRLARLGHAKGLHQTLDRLVAEHPARQAQAEALRGLVERFDFDGLVDHLQALQALQATATAERA